MKMLLASASITTIRVRLAVLGLAGDGSAIYDRTAIQVVASSVEVVYHGHWPPFRL